MKTDPIVWRIQSNKIAHTGRYVLEQEIAKEVARLTNNQFIIRILPAGGYVPAPAAFNSARTLKIDGMLMSPRYWGAADPVFSIMGGLVAAWDTSQEYNDWLIEDNGIRYLQDAYAGYGLTLLGFSVSSLESIVARDPITSIDDFIGKRVRTPPGMVKDYFAALGALPRLISASKVKTALQRSQVSLADFSDITYNYSAGLYQRAKHTNFPGFHSLTLTDFVVNTQSWQQLPENYKEAVNAAVKKWRVLLKERTQQEQAIVLERLEQEGVTVYAWSEEERKRARMKAVPIWQQYAKKSVVAAEIVDQLLIKLKAIGNL